MIEIIEIEIERVIVAAWLDNSIECENVMKNGLELTANSTKFIHPGYWFFSCESDYNNVLRCRPYWWCRTESDSDRYLLTQDNWLAFRP